MSREPIRSVVVAGGGPTAALAAAAFARALRGAAVTRVALPTPPGALGDRLPAVIAPDDPVLELLALDEGDLLAAGAAPRLGVRFGRWRADGSAFVQAAGPPAGAGERGGFHQLWLQARAADRSVPAYHQFLPAAVLGEAGRFTPPTEALPFDYGLALPAERWLALLASVGARAGVRVVTAPTLLPERADGDLRAARLPDGRRLEADLFVDASGPEPVLADAPSPAGWDDWSGALPVDRVGMGPIVARPTELLADRTALAAGWSWTAPVRGGALGGLAFASAHLSDAEAARLLPDRGLIAPVRPGRRRSPWRERLLLLGDAAAVLPPIGEAHTQLAASAVMRALDLLPGRDMAPLELAEYDRRTGRELDAARDMAALALARGPSREGGFWSGRADRPPAESLAHLLAAFEARGRLPHRDDDPFDREAWISLLIGLGITPRRTDPVEAVSDPARLAEALRDRARSLAEAAARAPRPDAQPPARTAGAA